MKGLFPYLRELLLGSPIDTPRCRACQASPYARCSSGYCWQHHYNQCTVRNWATGQIVYDCQYQPKEDPELAELRKLIQ